jgi:hypothetical protein
LPVQLVGIVAHNVLVDPSEAVEQAMPSTRTQVRRRGNILLREGGAWSPAVLALLRHLEDAGFDGSPRVVGTGFDAEGRETLTYLEGEVLHPNAWSDVGIAAFGRMLRRLHDAGRGFTPPPGARWQPWFTRSDRPDAVYGHGDIGPWNIVVVDGLPVGFIDWEFAGPVDPLDEVAQAAWLNAQLHDDVVAERNQLPTAEARAHQLRLFVDAYGLEGAGRSQLVSRMIDHAIRDAANELDQANPLKMAKRPTGPDDPGWAVAWRVRSAAWLVAHRPLLEGAIAG